MNVNIIGRHVRVTPEMETYAREKVAKLGRFFNGIQHVDVVMEVDGLNHMVETSAVLGRKAKLVGKALATDMYAAIDLAESKLEKQIRRFHNRLKSRRDRSRSAGPGEEARPEEAEATYEHVVRELLEEEEG
jgi:putative sigma-54 modulation protein